jgi:hypothetical protein
MVPVHLASDGGNIAVTFGQRGRQQVVTKLDPASLELVSTTAVGRSEAPAAPATGVARVELDDGSFIVCWTQENADGGRQVLAQLGTAKGSRLGESFELRAVSLEDAERSLEADRTARR